VYLQDTRGFKYLDFASGIAVNALGHNHAAVTEAIVGAAGFIHISNLYHHPYAKVFADDLLAKCWTTEGQVFFCNSGTEANEAAIKFGRKFGKTFGPEKINVLSFIGGIFNFLKVSISWKNYGCVICNTCTEISKTVSPIGSWVYSCKV
jgi:acetylornithine/succinyldiaminopimelate/putrescine aminotransferase